MKQVTVFLGLGSNLGNREDAIRSAQMRLGDVPSTHVVKSAALLETPAVLLAPDSEPQPPFLNTVVQLETTLTPFKLFAAVKRIEHDMGRVEGPKWSARVIDIDVLLYGVQIISTAELTIPHPLMHVRNFVLVPLCELAPELMHPVLKRSMKSLRALLPPRRQ